MAKGRKTGGRKAGVPNRSTRPIRELLNELAMDDAGEDTHLKRLHALTQADDPHVAVKALTLVMAYRHGKPTEYHEHTGANGGPIAYTWQA